MSTGFLTGFVNIVALAMWLVFIIAYIAYGNRMRHPAGRLMMVMSTGYMLSILVLALHRPFGLSAAGGSFFAWFQIAAVGASAAGTIAVLILLIRGHGGWPWQPPRAPHQDRGDGTAD